MIMILIIIILHIMLLRKEFDTESKNNSNSYLTDPNVLIKISTMLKDTDNILCENNINYWINAGTLLGAVRHKNIIPWDDDADICIFNTDEDKLLSLKSEFKKLNYGIGKWFGGYKIYALDGDYINMSGYEKLYYNYDLKFPFVDIFFVNAGKKNNIIQYSKLIARKMFAKEFYYLDEVFPLKKYKFGNFELFGPKNPYPYLYRTYGNDVMTTAYKNYDHKFSSKIKKIKINLTPDGNYYLDNK